MAYLSIWISILTLLLSFSSLSHAYPPVDYSAKSDRVPSASSARDVLKVRLFMDVCMEQFDLYTVVRRLKHLTATDFSVVHLATGQPAVFLWSFANGRGNLVDSATQQLETAECGDFDGIEFYVHARLSQCSMLPCRYANIDDLVAYLNSVDYAESYNALGAILFKVSAYRAASVALDQLVASSALLASFVNLLIVLCVVIFLATAKLTGRTMTLRLGVYDPPKNQKPIFTVNSGGLLKV